MMAAVLCGNGNVQFGHIPVEPVEEVVTTGKAGMSSSQVAADQNPRPNWKCPSGAAIPPGGPHSSLTAKWNPDGSLALVVRTMMRYALERSRIVDSTPAVSVELPNGGDVGLGAVS